MPRAVLVRMSEEEPDHAALAEAGRIIREGGLVAFPTETVYGLGGNALDAEAAEKIYRAKGRPSDNPLIVHIAEMQDLETVASSVPEAAWRMAEACWPGPLTMILPKTEHVPGTTTGGLSTVAVRLPDHRLAQELIHAAGGFVAAPSANRSGRPSPTEAAHVWQDLGEEIDMIIDGGPVRIGLESTIVDFSEEIPTILRPGYLGQQALEEWLGEVQWDAGLLNGKESETPPKAPGMRYRHYAPRGELILMEGPPEAVTKEIRRLVHEDRQSGIKVGILCAEESRAAYPEGEVRCLGSREEETMIAANLYRALRAFDDAGIERIYTETFDTPQMGAAIMNRLRKAAGGNSYQCS